MAVTVGSVALDIVMGRSTISSTIGSAMQDVQRAVTDTSLSVSQRIDTIGQSCTKIGTAMLPVSSAIAGLGTAGVKTYADLDQATNQYISSTGKSIAETEKYQDVLKDIHKNNYGEDYMDIADALGTVNQQMGDLSDEELKKVTESAFAMRDTFGFEVNESIRAVDTMMKNFGISSDEAFNLMVQGAQSGLDFSGELIDSINEYSVQFGKAGLSAEAMFSVMASGAEAGAWNLDKVGDAVKEFSIRAIDGSKTTAEGFAMIGLSADEMGAKFAQGGDSATQVFNTVIQKLGEMDDPMAQNAAGVALFGTMWEDLGPQVVTQLSAVTDGIDKSKASMDELKNTRYDDLTSQIETLKRTFMDDFLIPVGEIIVPILSDFVEAITPVVEAFGSLDKETQSTIVAVAGIIAAIGPALIIFGQMATGVGAVMRMFSGLSSLAGTLGGAMTALNPTVLIVVGVIAALIAVGVYLYKNWDEISAKASELWEKVKEEFSAGLKAVSEWVGNAVTWIGENWQGLLLFLVNPIAGAFKLLYDNCDQFREFVDNFVQNVKDFFVNGFNTIKDSVVNSVSNMYNSAKQKITELKDAFVNKVTEIRDGVVNGFNAMKDKAVAKVTDLKNQAINIFVNLKDGIGEKITWIKDTIVNGFNDAISFITSLPGQAYRWGSDIIDNIVSGIKSCIGKVKTAASDVAQSIRSFLHFTVPDEGPLADFDTYMPDMMSQLAGGMYKGIPQVRKAALSVADEMRNGLNVQADAPRLARVSTYGSESRQTLSTGEMLKKIIELIRQLLPAGRTAGEPMLAGAGGDIVIPIYLGNDLIENIVINAQGKVNLRSGGRA